MTYADDNANINTDALCEAFLSEGFTETTAEEGFLDDRARSFSRHENDLVVVKGAVDFEKTLTTAAVNWLFAVTDKPYPEVGGRNQRESALIAEINRLRREIDLIVDQQK